MAHGTFYVTEKIGPKQSRTPEGFLLCEEVPIARSGMMIYGPDETPIAAGPDGIAKIFRENADVFRAETIASAQGKPVTNDHPDEDVTPESWKELTHGIAMNVRRGEGAMDDLLLADFLITTPEGIEAILSGKREVSMGYEADYEEVSPGVGRQTNLIINHIALVEQGRCGPRCAISDSKPTISKGNSMSKKHSRILDALMKAFKAKDANEVEELAKEVADELPVGGEEDRDTHIHIHAGTGPEEVVNDEEPGAMEEGRAKFTDDQIQEHMDQNAAEHAEMRERLDALEAAIASLTGGAAATDEDPELMEAIKDEVPEELAAEASKAKDSAFLGESFQDTVAMAEILVPGIRVPVYDRAAKPVQTFKKICGLRKQALDLAYVQPGTRAILDEILEGKPLDTKTMTCDAARVLFRSAASTKRTLNNIGGGNSNRVADAAAGKKAGVTTIAELNRRNAERYSN